MHVHVHHIILIISWLLFKQSIASVYLFRNALCIIEYCSNASNSDEQNFWQIGKFLVIRHVSRCHWVCMCIVQQINGRFNSGKGQISQNFTPPKLLLHVYDYLFGLITLALVTAASSRPVWVKVWVSNFGYCLETSLK